MVDIQAWFAPLLWFVGTITTLAMFVRFCKPVWAFFKSPTQLATALTTLTTKMDKHFEDVDARLDKFDKDIADLKGFDSLSSEVQINLLRDRLTSGYEYHSERGFIGNESYRSLCDIHSLYKKYGGNSYADTLMTQLEHLYKNPTIPPKRRASDEGV